MQANVDAHSRQWIEQLRVGHPRREQTVARLHEVLRRIALRELSRRRHQLLWISGPEFEDLAHQAADDALVNVLDRLDEFRGLSRFTTWAYKFAVFEVSAAASRQVPRSSTQSNCPTLGSAVRRTGSSSAGSSMHCRTHWPS
jgi:RNA polymerase sigma-70 factor (ECF subfamily)